jgi:hypothetical protein
VSAASNYLENKLIDHSLGTTSFTAPSTVYVALFTSDPTDAGTGTEVSGGGYARQSATFAAASSGSASTDATVTFPTATGNFGTVTHVAIFDAVTTGNMLFHGAVTTSKTIETGDTFQISTGNLTISLD